MAKVRLGFADVAIARPLTWAILKGEHSEVFATTLLPHSRVAPLLCEGALDVGLVSAREVDQYRLTAVADLGVVLVAGGGAAHVQFKDPSITPRTAAIHDPECPGVSAVANQWVQHRFGELEPPGSGAPDIRLMPGLRTDVAGSDSRDLATSWQEDFREEPLAYVWAHRPNADLGEAEFALKSSLRFGLGSLLALSRELAAERGLEAEAVAHYLSTSVRFVRRASSVAS